MNRLVMISFAMAVFATLIFLSGCAGPGRQEEVAKIVEKGSGDTVLLFHGGSKEAKDVFCLNETLPAYRATWESYGTMTFKEVGKVKITGMRGDHYFDGEVVEGDVKDGDIVRKQGLGCLVRVPEEEKNPN